MQLAFERAGRHTGLSYLTPLETRIGCGTVSCRRCFAGTRAWSGDRMEGRWPTDGCVRTLDQRHLVGSSVADAKAVQRGRPLRLSSGPVISRLRLAVSHSIPGVRQVGVYPCRRSKL